MFARVLDVTILDLIIKTAPIPDAATSADFKPALDIFLPFKSRSLNYLKRYQLMPYGILTHLFPHKTAMEILRLNRNNRYIFKISGARKVIHALNILIEQLNQIPSPTESQITLRDALIAYREACQLFLKTQQREVPVLSKSSTSLIREQTCEIDPKKVSAPIHAVYPVWSKTKRYFFKEIPSSRSVAEIEAFNGLCYRLLIGERHPLTRPVHNETGRRVGVLSAAVPGYKSMNEIILEGGGNVGPSQEALLKGGVAKIWTAALIEEEYDLNGGNYGFNDRGECVKIDGDHSSWAQISKYHGFDPALTSATGRTAPSKVFPITRRDILTFPKLPDADPANWPGRSDARYIKFDVIMHDPAFVYDKYYTLLKRILIPNSAYAAIGSAVMRSEKKRQTLVESKCQKTKALRDVLIAMPEFQEFVLQNPQALPEMCQAFHELNESYKKDKYASLRINVGDIENAYQQLVSDIKTLCTSAQEASSSQSDLQTPRASL